MDEKDMKKLKEAAEKVVALIRHEYEPYTTVAIRSDEIRVVEDDVYIPLK